MEVGIAIEIIRDILTLIGLLTCLFFAMCLIDWWNIKRQQHRNHRGRHNHTIRYKTKQGKPWHNEL